MRWQFFAHRFRATAPTTTLTIADVTGLWDFGGTALDGLLITRAAEQDNLTASPARLYVSSIDGTPSSSDQVEITVGQCITLTYLVRTRTGGVLDVTNSPTTTFFTDPARGEFSQPNVFCATEAERNTVFTVYARYQDPVTGQSVTDGVIVKVRR
jgi:hypothetical protein